MVIWLKTAQRFVRKLAGKTFLSIGQNHPRAQDSLREIAIVLLFNN